MQNQGLRMAYSAKVAIKLLLNMKMFKKSWTLFIVLHLFSVISHLSLQHGLSHCLCSFEIHFELNPTSS